MHCARRVIIGKLMIHAKSPARDSLVRVTSSMKTPRPWLNLVFDLILQIFIYKKKTKEMCHKYKIDCKIAANQSILHILVL